MTSSRAFRRSLRQVSRRSVATACVLAAAHAAPGQCPPAWDDVFATPGTIGNGVNAVCVWDDGTGPAVYLGGDFSQIGNIRTSGFPLPNGTGANGIVKVTATGYQALDKGIGPNQTSQVGVLGGPKVVRALAAYDPDGSGPLPSMLYVAGSFMFASEPGTTITSQRWSIAAWNGTSWQRVGPEGAPGLELGDLSVGDAIRFNVRAMAVYDPDQGGPLPPELYVGGAFPTAGGVSAQGIARWNGVSSTWSDVGGPFAGSQNVVYALAVVDEDLGGPLPPVLYAAGRLTAMGDGTVVTGLAKWNGTSWSAVPGIVESAPGNPGVDGITALGVHRDGAGETLWVGGNMLVNGVPCGVARLVNGSWECVFSDGGPLGGTIANDYLGLPMTVQRIAQFGQDMYFLGPPSGPAPTPCVQGSYRGGLYRWNAASGQTAWVADIDALTHALGSLGTGDRLHVGTMTSIDFDLGGPGSTELFIGGNFNVVGGRMRTDMCLFDGTNFESIVPHASNALGLVGSAGQDDGRVLYVADLDGSGPLPRSLIVAGRFHGAGDVVSPNVIGFNGVSYFPMPVGSSATRCDGVDFNGSPAFLDFATFNDGTGEKVYAASSNGVLVWSGTAWEKLADAPGFVRQLEVFNDGSGPALWALGGFSMIEGVPARGCAKWNGTTWIATDNAFAVAAMPSNVFLNSVGVVNLGSGDVLLASGTDYTDDDALGEDFLEVYVGGQWVPFNGVPAFGNLQGVVNDLLVFNGQLFLAGLFSQVNGLPSSAKVIRWNSGQWLDTGAVSSLAAYRLAAHDDTSGPALYFAPQSSTATLQKWDGATTWSAVPSGTIGNLADLASFEDASGTALYVAHAGFFADGKWAVGLARLRSPCRTCPADFNRSGNVTVQDIFDFLIAYFAGDSSADFNGVGGVTVQDIFDFLVAYFAGCD